MDSRRPDRRPGHTAVPARASGRLSQLGRRSALPGESELPRARLGSDQVGVYDVPHGPLHAPELARLGAGLHALGAESDWLSLDEPAASCRGGSRLLLSRPAPAAPGAAVGDRARPAARG